MISKHPIFDLGLSNQQLFEVFMLEKSGQTLDQIQKIFKPKNKNVEAETNQQNIYKIIYESLKNAYDKELILLHVIA